MSLIFMDGFDDGLLSLKWTTVNAAVITGARNGNGVYIVYNDQYLRKQVQAADEHATFVVGTAVYIVGNRVDRFLSLVSDSGATTHLTVAFTANKELQVYRGSLGTLLGTTAMDVFAFSAWFYLEVKAVLHDSTGSVVVKINGVTVLNLTGIDTKNGGTKTVFDSIYLWGTWSGPGAPPSMYYDDLYLCNGAGSVNNDFLGDCTIQTLRPNGNGNSSQWVGSDADSVNNYLLVDETPPNTTDYVESGTATNIDLYTFADVTGAPAIKAVATRAYISKSDAGAQLMRQTARIGGTNYPNGTDDAPSFGSYTLASRLMELSPATSAAWTYTEVNGAEFGVEAR